MWKAGDMCPKCDRGKLMVLEDNEAGVILTCDHQDCQFMVDPDGVPRCPECYGSGVYKGSHKSDIGMYACYSCGHEFEAPAPKRAGWSPGISTARRIPDTLTCPHCKPTGPAGVLVEAGPQISTYHCRHCGNHFYADQKSPLIAMTVNPTQAPGSFRRPRKHDLDAAQQAERCMPTWHPPARWREYAQEGPLGVLYWWPKGLSQERREAFLDDAIELLRLTGPSNNIDEEAYAVADNLFRLWWEGIKR